MNAQTPKTTWNGDQPDAVMIAIAPVIETRDCWCEWVDIGVGSQRVDENPECPVHTPMGFALAVVSALSGAGLLTSGGAS
jgi:hypothetical protein